jgi:hypothetical protein
MTQRFFVRIPTGIRWKVSWLNDAIYVAVEISGKLSSIAVMLDKQLEIGKKAIVAYMCV